MVWRPHHLAKRTIQSSQQRWPLGCKFQEKWKSCRKATRLRPLPQLLTNCNDDLRFAMVHRYHLYTCHSFDLDQQRSNSLDRHHFEMLSNFYSEHDRIRWNCIRIMESFSKWLWVMHSMYWDLETRTKKLFDINLGMYIQLRNAWAYIWVKQCPIRPP